MADAWHFMGGDLAWSSNGDIQTVDSVQESQQRILRRLPTNPGDYIWHPEYGGGILKWIGRPIEETEMKTDIVTQMYLEDSVVQNPQPQVDFVTTVGGAVTSGIRYVESDSNEPVGLTFSAKP